MIFDQMRRLYYRGRRLADVPAMLRYLEFRELRQRYYDEFWPQAASRIDARAEAWDDGYWRISKGGRTAIVKQYSVMLDSQVMLNVMGNKALTLSLLREKGCPIPAFHRFAMPMLAEAEAFLRSLARPVVVKPMSGTGGGQGVTTGIRSSQELRRAAKFASRFDTDLLIEEQLEGHSYRLLFLNGRYIDAVRRDPPAIAGDGRSSIKQLMSAETAKRLKDWPVTALSPLQIDADCLNCLTNRGLSLPNVPKAGEQVIVKRAVNENSHLQNHCVKDEVHPDTIALGSRIAKHLGVQLAGIDIICTDISKPLAETGGRIGEINTTPGLHHHYLLAEPQKGSPVAEILLDYMFSTGEGTMRLSPAIGPTHRKGALHAA